SSRSRSSRAGKRGRGGVGGGRGSGAWVSGVRCRVSGVRGQRSGLGSWLLGPGSGVLGFGGGGRPGRGYGARRGPAWSGAGGRGAARATAARRESLGAAVGAPIPRVGTSRMRRGRP